MSISISLNFDSFEDLELFIADMNKYRKWKSKQQNKKEKPTNEDTETGEQFNFTEDRRGMHQQAYHNQAKLYQKENPHLSYREALKEVYKNNKKVEI
jgi:hypothetical protein